MLKVLPIFLLIALVAGGVFYFTSQKKADIEPITLQKVKVRLAWKHQAQFAGMYVAKVKGYYKDAGLDVDLQEFVQDLDQTDELAKGNAHFSIMSASEFFPGIDNGDKVKAIGVIYQINPYTLVALPEKNIKSPKDFKGKILGKAGGNAQSTATYTAVLHNANIPESQVTYKVLGFDTAADFKAKNADVMDLYRTDQTYLIEKMGLPYNLILPEVYGFETYGDTIVTSNKLITDNPKLVQAFMDATIKGWEYAIANVNESVNLLLPYTSAEYNDFDYEKHILTASVPLIKPSGGKIGDMQFIPWNKAFEALDNAGLFKNKLNVKDTYTTQFIHK